MSILGLFFFFSAARLAPALTDDAVYIVEQTARCRSLGFAFSWRCDVAAPPDIDASSYERERDAAVATFVAALERRSDARCALAWVGVEPASSNDLASMRSVAAQVLLRGRTFVRRVLGQFGWQPSAALQWLLRHDTTWNDVLKLLARDASDAAPSDVRTPQTATRLLEAGSCVVL